jgi:cellobiose-specific phosphotransferase system component IIC
MASMFEDTTAALGRAWNWSAVLKGTFLALATFVVLRYFGAALGVSTGNGVLETGFAVWSVIVQIVSVAVGAALAGYLTGSRQARDGAIAGISTWVVTIVLMSTLFGAAGPQTARSALWAAFLGALLSLGAAVIGGILGGQLVRRPVISPAGPPSPPSRL